MVKGMKRWIVQCKPPRIAAILILLAFGRHYLLSSGGGLLYQAAGLGIFLEVLGFCIMLWAWWLFKKANTSVCPLSDDTVLVDYGIYQLTRNPMYLGLTLILLGIAFIAGGIAYYTPASSKRLNRRTGPLSKVPAKVKRARCLPPDTGVIHLFAPLSPVRRKRHNLPVEAELTQ